MGDLFSISSEGRSPHDYSPGPHDIRAAAASRLFLTTRMPFENTLLRPLAHGNVKVVDVSEGISRIPFGVNCDHQHAEDPHAGHAHAPGEPCSDDGLDPHVWLSLDNAVRIAENIEKAYAALDPAHAAVYRANREALSREFTALEQEVKRELAPLDAINDHNPKYLLTMDYGPMVSHNGIKQLYVLDWLCLPPPSIYARMNTDF